MSHRVASLEAPSDLRVAPRLMTPRKWQAKDPGVRLRVQAGDQGQSRDKGEKRGRNNQQNNSQIRKTSQSTNSRTRQVVRSAVKKQVTDGSPRQDRHSYSWREKTFL